MARSGVKGPFTWGSSVERSISITCKTINLQKYVESILSKELSGEGCEERKFYLQRNGGPGEVIIREIENMVDDPLTVNIGAPGTLVLD